MSKETPNPNDQTRQRPRRQDSLGIGHWSFIRHWSLDISHSPTLYCLLALLALLFPSPARAHPLGNDSITHIGILWILPDRVEFDLFLDFAETPSQPYPAQIDTDKDGQESRDEQRAWLKQLSAANISSLTVTLDGQPVPLTAPDRAQDPLTGKPTPTIPGLIKVPRRRRPAYLQTAHPFRR
jgi:hypothetical protein